MTLETLNSGILSFCGHLCAALGEPVVKSQIIATAPVKVRVGITIPDVLPEAIQAACNASGAMREAFQTTWPENVVGGCNPKSIAVAGDNQTVIFDLTFYSMKIETPDHLTPAAA